MKRIGIIPARYNSSRFEGKVIADLCGKPVIQYVYENATKTKLLDDILIATDDSRISDIAKSFGAKVIETSNKPKSGTERIIEALDKIDEDVDIVINIQADEPMIKHEMIDDITKSLLDDKDLNVVTLKKELTDKDEIADPNIVKVVVDKDNFAIYFSRSVIPYPESTKDLVFYKHIGIYGYRRNFLSIFDKLEVSSLEQVEKLEQLRILGNGFKIKVIDTKYETIGVDTKKDLEKLIQIFKK